MLLEREKSIESQNTYLHMDTMIIFQKKLFNQSNKYLVSILLYILFQKRKSVLYR